ncbi:MFS transporter [Loktanella sp. M215]|nr:MFS transporter [Loktanella sp. M215]
MTDALFRRVVDDPDSDGGLPEAARAVEPGSFLRHVAALSASKIADGLIDPKLVLSWLLTHVGAGPFWVGLLVPVRESGALLPQLLTTPWITAAPVRKWFWAGGSAVQGICAGAIALAGLTLSGATAGAVIVALLSVLALARSVCSASYKDVLGKTVGKSRRGTATGFASSAAAALVIVFALVLLSGLAERFVVVTAALLLAAAFWLIAAAVMATLAEVRSDAGEVAGVGWGQFRLLRDDPQLARFIVVRSLLVGTALAPPYFLLLRPDTALNQLGALVLASAVASLVSAYVWGRLSDRSSRRVLMYAGLAGGAVLSLVVALALTGWVTVTGVIPVALFGLMIAYQGVRLGRSTHLVDMAEGDDRAPYTALSNTIVGLVLIVAGGLFAAVGEVSVPLVIALFAVMCWAAAALAVGLDEVQSDG